MVFLYFRNDKRLILTRTTDTYVNENKFETIKIICEKVIDGYNIENTTVQLNVIPPHGQAVDIINLDLTKDENVDSRLSTEIKIPIEYLQMSGDLKFQIKVYDNEVIGKSNIALFEIVNTLEVENFLTDNQLTMLDQYVTRFEKIASDLDKQLDENKNFPNIGIAIGKENENWWIWDNDINEYIDTGVLAKANITVDNITFKITDSGILQVEYKNGEHFETTDLGKVVGDKGEKGDKGDNGVSIIDIRKTSSNELVDTYTIYYSNNTTSTFDITNGKNGTNGKDGINGVDGLKGDDGVSPVVELNKSETVTTLTITDKNGTQTVTINDGINGANGKDGIDGINGTDGQDGYSPTINVDKVDKVTTLSITDKNGNRSVVINDGVNGINGVDGISPIVELNKTNNTTKLSITDKDGTKSVDILDGEKGANGDDYVLTDEDKQDIATVVTGDLSNKLDSKQDKLIAGENIKTVNGESLLGEGNLAISSGAKLIGEATTSEMVSVIAVKPSEELQVNGVYVLQIYGGFNDQNMSLTSGTCQLRFKVRDSQRSICSTTIIIQTLSKSIMNFGYGMLFVPSKDYVAGQINNTVLRANGEATLGENNAISFELLTEDRFWVKDTNIKIWRLI